MRNNSGGAKVRAVRMSAIILTIWALLTSNAGRTQTPQANNSVVDGVWQVDTPNGGLWTITLKPDGPRLTGSISVGHDDPEPFDDGKVDGSTVVFKLIAGNGDRTITFTGKVAAGEIAFTRDVEVRPGGNPGGTGPWGARAVREFTAKRVAAGPSASPLVIPGQQPPIREFQQWARQHVHAIASVDGDVPGNADLRQLRDMIRGAHVVAFGEPFHGGHEPLAMRNRLIRYAVTQLGFTAVALESALSTSKRLYDHVLGITNEPDPALKESFSYGFGEYPENLELITWLRSFNAVQPPARRVRLYGIDLTGNNCPCAYRSIEAVMTFLDRADAGLSREFRQRYADVVPIFRSDEYRKLAPTERDSVAGKIQDMVALIRREYIPLAEIGRAHV